MITISPGYLVRRDAGYQTRLTLNKTLMCNFFLRNGPANIPVIGY